MSYYSLCVLNDAFLQLHASKESETQLRAAEKFSFKAFLPKRAISTSSTVPFDLFLYFS